MRESWAAGHRFFPESSAERKLVLLAYVLHLCAVFVVFTVFPAVAGVVINYIKRDETVPPYAQHHHWMIRTFWWGTLWAIIGFAFTWAGIGWLILFVLAIWWIYRHVRGIVSLIDGSSLPL